MAAYLSTSLCEVVGASAAGGATADNDRVVGFIWQALDRIGAALWCC